MGTGLPVRGDRTGQTFYKSASETARWTDGKTKNWTARIKAHTKDPESVMGAGYTGISGEGI